MGKRVYGQIHNLTENESISEKETVHVELSSAIKLERSIRKYVISFLLTFVLICVCIIFVVQFMFDGFCGSADAHTAVYEYINAVTMSDIQSAANYLPKSIRTKGYVADTDLEKLNDMFKNENISVIDISVVGVASDLDLKVLSDNFVLFYGENIDIDSVEQCSVTVDIEKSGKRETVAFDVVAVKLDYRWYVFSANLDDTSLSVPNQAENNVPSATANRDIDYNNLAAFDELLSGHVSINGKSYQLPVPYSDMKSLFVIDEFVLNNETRILNPNCIAGPVPVRFTNMDVSNHRLFMSIANITDVPIDILDGTVVSLYLEHMDDAVYPDVYLPGNLTFGQTYDTILDVYPKLTEYQLDHNNTYVSKSGATAVYFPDRAECRTYELPLNGNKRNHMYLQFTKDSDDNYYTLGAMQWVFYDLNEF